MNVHLPISFQVKGTPRRHKSEKTTTYFDWVSVKIPEVDPLDAPVALRIRNASSRREEVRIIDGEFYYPFDRYNDLTDAALGAVCELKQEPEKNAKAFVGSDLIQAIAFGEIEKFERDFYPGSIETNRNSKVSDLSSRMSKMAIIEGVVWEKKGRPVLLYCTDGRLLENMEMELRIIDEHEASTHLADVVFNPTASPDEINETIRSYVFNDAEEIPEIPEVEIPEVLDYDLQEQEFLTKVSDKNTDIWERIIGFCGDSFNKNRDYGIVNGPQLIAVLTLRELIKNREKEDIPIEAIEAEVEKIIETNNEDDEHHLGTRIDDMQKILERWQNREMEIDFSHGAGMVP